MSLYRLLFLIVVYLYSSSPLALKRGIGFGRGNIDASSSSPLGKIGNINTFFDEVVYSDGFFGISHEIRYQWANDINGSFNGLPTNDYDLRVFSGTLGIRLNDQSGFLQPWIGASLIFSSVNLQQPDSASFPFLDDEVKFAKGWFAESGIDFVFNDKYGLRLGVKYNQLKTDRFRSLGSNLDFDYLVMYAAYVITFRGCNPWWFLNELGIGPTQGC